MAEFGSLAATIAASAARQHRVTGSAITTRALQSFRSAALHATRQRISDDPLIGSSPALLDYLRLDLADRHVECARVLYLDIRNRLIADELVSEGTVDESAVYIREVLARALELGASALIIAHNHPSGDCTPSRADIELTRGLKKAAEPLRIWVHDHVIVSRSGHTSLRARFLI